MRQEETFCYHQGRVLSFTLQLALSRAATTPASQSSATPREGCASGALVSCGDPQDLPGWTLAAGKGDHCGSLL